MGGGALLSTAAGIIRLAPNDWVNLNNSFGYVPLAGTKFYQKRELNNGAAFFKLVIDHGERPATGEGVKYAYALLPNAGIEETAEFYSEPSVEILAQNDRLHAVRDNETGIIGINAFEAGESLCGVTFLTPCSLMIEGNKFFVSDPSQTQSSVSLEFDSEIEAVSEDDITQDGRVVTVNMLIKGKSYSFTANGF